MSIVIEERDVRLSEIEKTDSIFDTDKKTMALMQDSIKEIDMFIPIMIYPTTQYKNKKYAIAEGRRRYEIYEKQGKDVIRAFIIDPSYRKIVEIDAEICRRRISDATVDEMVGLRGEYYNELHNNKHTKVEIPDPQYLKLKAQYEKEKEMLQAEYRKEIDELQEQIEDIKVTTRERFEKEVEKRVKDEIKAKADEYEELSNKDKKKFEDNVRKEINKELTNKYEKTLKERENALEISKNNYQEQQKKIDAHLSELEKQKRATKEHAELSEKYKRDSENLLKKLENVAGIDMITDRLIFVLGDIERTNKVINENKDIFMPHKAAIMEIVSKVEDAISRTKVLFKK